MRQGRILQTTCAVSYAGPIDIELIMTCLRAIYQRELSDVCTAPARMRARVSAEGRADVPGGGTGPLAVGKFCVWLAVRASRRNAEHLGASRTTLLPPLHMHTAPRRTVPRVMHCMAMRVVWWDRAVVKMDILTSERTFTDRDGTGGASLRCSTVTLRVLIGTEADGDCHCHCIALFDPCFTKCSGNNPTVVSVGYA